jgi:hypothetical protein
MYIHKRETDSKLRENNGALLPTKSHFTPTLKKLLKIISEYGVPVGLKTCGKYAEPDESVGNKNSFKSTSANNKKFGKTDNE